MPLWQDGSFSSKPFRSHNTGHYGFLINMDWTGFNMDTCIHIDFCLIHIKDLYGLLDTQSSQINP